MSTTPETPKKTSRKWIILLIIIVLIACGVAGYALWMIRGLSSASPASTTAPATAEVTVPHPLFFPLEPFTVNLVDRASQEERVLYVGFTLRLTDTQTQERLMKYLPEVRNRILLLLSHQQQDVLQTEEGKTALAAQIRTALNSPFAQGLPEQNIADILYNTFILR
ncbi:flagellar basal body-associated protein FliL [Rosenbergiella australiborealis]|uniref:Flagellar protein FliL n=1 Tax=Rosenbergiella australiborealis TaxID=1544696 RepID=A0ABS5TA38_9GAMM|nr:flagellar basal body-associated protein FliL [Rosenbergiella australiborealis]MBT0728312.1 flagellar basal body-associated protein FliL [Rosenbergiella australiborealis]